MENTNGYLHDGKWQDDAANGQYLFAKKGGNDYFLKRFREPKYPKEGSSPEFYETKKKECEEWKKERKNVIAALQNVAAGGGNIVVPIEIFLDRPCYIQATRKVDTSSFGFKEVISLSENDRLLLLKTLCMSMKLVHSVAIVHGDLKPDNILISETKGHRFVCKIIDFDDSYFSKRPPLPENTVGTEPYWSPELAVYKISGDAGKANIVTCKSDIFALGLIFHQYCTGGKMPDLQGYAYAYQMVCDHKQLKASTSIKPLYLQELINQMLSLDPGKRPSSEEVYLKLSGVMETSSVNVSAVSFSEGGSALVNNKPDVRVKKGTTVTFRAYAAPGYKFEYWKALERTVMQPVWSFTAEQELTAVAYFKKAVIKDGSSWPTVEALAEKPKRVRVTFEDGRTRILDKSIAETMGWKC